MSWAWNGASGILAERDHEVRQGYSSRGMQKLHVPECAWMCNFLGETEPIGMSFTTPYQTPLCY